MATMVKFKQAACLNKKDYPYNSVTEVTEELAANPHFMKLVEHGLVVEIDAPVTVTAESFHDRQVKLMNKLMEPKAKKAETPVEPVIPNDPPAGSTSDSTAPQGEQREQGEQSPVAPIEDVKDAAPVDAPAEMPADASDEQEEAPVKKKKSKG